MGIIPFNQENANREYRNNYPQYGGINVYSGAKYQKGYGLGNILSGLFRSAVPLLKKGAISLGKTALQTGLNIAKDGLEGKNMKQSLNQNVKQARKQVIGKVIGKLKEAPKYAADNRYGHVTSQYQVAKRNKTRKRKAQPITRVNKSRRRGNNVKSSADIFE